MSLHLEDPDLIQFLDDQVDSEVHASMSSHLATCASCAGRLQMIEQRLRRLESLLAEGDPPGPALPRAPAPRFRLPRLVAVAATAAVLVGVALAVQPVRAWIVERSQDLWTLVAGRSQDAGQPSPISDAHDATTASVTFTPVRQPFVIRIARRQAAGSMTVETGSVTHVTALVLGGSETEDLLVLPDGLLVRNSEESVASYHVTVPASLDAIRVEVDGRVLVTLAPRGGPSRWTGGLGGSGPP